MRKCFRGFFYFRWEMELLISHIFYKPVKRSCGLSVGFFLFKINSQKPACSVPLSHDAGKMRRTEVYKTQTTNIFQIHESDYVETPHYLAWFVYFFSKCIKTLLHGFDPNISYVLPHCSVANVRRPRSTCPYSLQCNKAWSWDLPILGVKGRVNLAIVAITQTLLDQMFTN